MGTKSSLVTIGRYFTYEESERIKVQLNSFKIKHLISGHGPNLGDPTGVDASEYFEIRVESDKLEKAKEIIKKEKVHTFLTSLKCPKCGHLGHVDVVNKIWFEKIYYIGTRLVECKKCKKRFPI